MNHAQVATAPPVPVHVLSVDDDPPLRESIAGYLGTYGVRVADDDVIKPFSARELLARSHFLRRHRAETVDRQSVSKAFTNQE